MTGSKAISQVNPKTTEMEKMMERMIKNDSAASKTNDDLSPAEYLSHLVTLKKALHQLNQHPAITLCGNDLSIHVYQGIGELATAAGQPLTVNRRNCRDFPMELGFVYQGVSFCELKSAAVVEGLG